MKKMDNILCKLGFHRPDKYRYLKETRYHLNGKKNITGIM